MTRMCSCGHVHECIHMQSPGWAGVEVRGWYCISFLVAIWFLKWVFPLHLEPTEWLQCLAAYLSKYLPCRLHHSWGERRGPFDYSLHACMPRALPTESSPQPPLLIFFKWILLTNLLPHSMQNWTKGSEELGSTWNYRLFLLSLSRKDTISSIRHIIRPLFSKGKGNI